MDQTIYIPCLSLLIEIANPQSPFAGLVVEKITSNESMVWFSKTEEKF